MQKFRLAIEALGVRHSGAATVLSDLVEAAVSDARFEKIYVFCSPKESRRFDFPPSEKVVAKECPLAEMNKIYRLWWIERCLPEHLRRLRCDVLICLSGCGCGGSAAPHLTMIQQSLPFSPEALRLTGLGRRLQLRVIRSAMRRSCRSSQRVLVQTNAMAATVGSAFALPPERLRVIPPSIRQVAVSGPPSNALRAMRAARAGARILYVGNRARYKNVTLLLQAAEQLRPRIPELATFLTWPSAHPVNGKHGVVCVGYLSGPELAEAYSLADVFVMPSLQETVGLPLLEAMSAGTPIVAADVPYAREVCGAAALFFDPYECLSLVRAIELVLGDRELRLKLIAEGRRLSRLRHEARPYQQMLDEAAATALKQGPNE